MPAGVLVEVTGRNGAGKSSLLRVLAGVLAPAAERAVQREAERLGLGPLLEVSLEQLSQGSSQR